MGCGSGGRRGVLEQEQHRHWVRRRGREHQRGGRRHIVEQQLLERRLVQQLIVGRLVEQLVVGWRLVEQLFLRRVVVLELERRVGRRRRGVPDRLLLHDDAYRDQGLHSGREHVAADVLDCRRLVQHACRRYVRVASGVKLLLPDVHVSA